MRCPVCRADNAQGPQCRRCKADLVLLFELEERRRQALTGACRCAVQAELARALRLAEGADALRTDHESQQLLAVLHLLRRDFARAWRSTTSCRAALSAVI